MYDRFNWTPASHARNAILRAYEPIQPYLLFCLADTLGCRTFIDVGANIGAYSLFLSSVPTISQVHAFEASPETAAELIKNVSLNNLDEKVRVYRNAVSSAPGVGSFGIVRSLSGANSIISTSIHEARDFCDQIEVETVRLDDVLRGPGEPLVLKVDVEGHEREALLGMRQLLSQSRSLLQVERYAAATSYEDLLSELGYRRLFQLGPDLYVSNTDLTPKELLAGFERASTLMIEAGKAIPRPQGGAARVRNWLQRLRRLYPR